MFDVEAVRGDFPILGEKVHGRPLVYFDNAATMQMPRPVVEAVAQHYLHDNGNVHRGIHELSNRSTRKLEKARETVARFIGAANAHDIVFTSGTTGSLNLIATSLSIDSAFQGAHFIVTHAEHHSNFVPWQQAADRVRGTFEAVDLDENADVDMADLDRRIDAAASAGDAPVVLAITHASNVTGAVTDMRRACCIAHEHGAVAVVDAAQSAPHVSIDVGDMGCDFLAFSGHKLGSLTGIGVLYIAPEWQERLKPSAFGGEMVDRVRLGQTTFESAPLKFEAGTPNYVGALSLDAAIKYLESIGAEEAHAHERAIAEYARGRLETLPGVTVLGHPRTCTPLVSFVVDGAHPFDIATLLDARGIAVRSGTNCAQPLLADVFGLDTVVRMSFAYYNTEEEVDRALETLTQVIALLR